MRIFYWGFSFKEVAYGRPHTESALKHSTALIAESFSSPSFLSSPFSWGEVVEVGWMTSVLTEVIKKVIKITLTSYLIT